MRTGAHFGGRRRVGGERGNFGGTFFLDCYL